MSEWEDKPLPEDADIDAAHPMRSGRHDLYAEAMRLVGARHSKGGLVTLVNWLLHRVESADLAAKVANRGWHKLPGELPPPGLGVIVWRPDRLTCFMACTAQNGEWCKWDGLLAPLGWPPSHWRHAPGDPAAPPEAIADAGADRGPR